MRTLQLTDAESTLLLELLELGKKDLQHEIHHTDALAMRHQLRARDHVIRRLAERISETESAGILKHPAEDTPATKSCCSDRRQGVDAGVNI